ncbi:hypothetical protein Bca4012_055268 [Brassica carinata]
MQMWRTGFTFHLKDYSKPGPTIPHMPIWERENGILTTEKGLKACQSEIETVSSETLSCYTLASGTAKQITGLKEDIRGVKMELKCSKYMVASLLLIALFVRFFM